MAKTAKQREQYKKTYRETHREKARAESRKYRNDHQEQIRKYRNEHREQIAKQYHIWWIKWYALNKESRKDYGRKYRMGHLLEIKIKGRDWRHKLKSEVMTQYGNGKCGCVKCGESRLACLSLDHIQGKGNEKRRRGELSGMKLYFQLRKLGFPQGTYQTLCMNCQWVKRIEMNELPFQ